MQIQPLCVSLHTLCLVAQLTFASRMAHAPVKLWLLRSTRLCTPTRYTRSGGSVVSGCSERPCGDKKSSTGSCSACAAELPAASLKAARSACTCAGWMRGCLAAAAACLASVGLLQSCTGELVSAPPEYLGLPAKHNDKKRLLPRSRHHYGARRQTCLQIYAGHRAPELVAIGLSPADTMQACIRYSVRTFSTADMLDHCMNACRGLAKWISSPASSQHAQVTIIISAWGTGALEARSCCALNASADVDTSLAWCRC